MRQLGRDYAGFSALVRTNPCRDRRVKRVAASFLFDSPGTNVAADPIVPTDNAATSDSVRAPAGGAAPACIYWHRQLPPLAAQMMGEHVLEAASHRVRDSLACRDELWESCYRSLMANVDGRLRQEIRRLGGDCVHVLNESIDSRHDAATGEAWLHGRYDYVLYQWPRPDAGPTVPV